MLGVSAQSVSKWERGETLPDIALLPALANLYAVSVDELIGMDRINSDKTRNAVFAAGHDHMRAGDREAAVSVYREALKTFPNDEGIISELAMALALDDDPKSLQQAVELCERVLQGSGSEKVRHTTRAALCFIYFKAGEKEKAVAAAGQLPHTRESRETILKQFELEPDAETVDAYIKFIMIGESDQQDVILIDFGMEMITMCTDHDLTGKISALREELGAHQNNEGFKKLPMLRLRDEAGLPPKHVRLRYYADVLLDKEFADPAEAADEIMAILRKIATRHENNDNA